MTLNTLFYEIKRLHAELLTLKPFLIDCSKKFTRILNIQLPCLEVFELNKKFYYNSDYTV